MVRKILRKAAVLELTGYSTSTLYTKISQGKFPKPVKLDPEGRASGWVEDEVQAVVKAAIDRRDVAA